MLGTAGGDDEIRPAALPLKRRQELEVGGGGGDDEKLAAAAATARKIRRRLWRWQAKMVMPSQSKQEWGAGNKEPAI